MKGHHLSVLVVVAVVAIVAALWTSSIREPSGMAASAGAQLVPGLADSLNDVTTVRLTGPGGQSIATLSRAGEHWTLAEKHGYYADVAGLRELLLKLAQSELVEEKTSNAEYYDRLGVQDIESADAGGVLIELEGVEAPALIIGNQAGSRQGVYARQAGEATSWLASGDITIADETDQWLDKQLIDINAARIAEVEIIHPDGDRLRIYKSTFGQPDFEVAEIPSGRELERDNIANPVGSVIQDLRFDDVSPAAEAGEAPAAAIQAIFRTFDGLVINTAVEARDDKHYVNLSAAADAELARRYQSQPEAAEGEEPPPLPPAPDVSAIAGEAEAINQRLGGWVYEIPKFKYDYFARRMEELLKDSS
ncbi:MAG: DUF4340 domain-containing protein [Gammaproteobacteria bacterium]|nr:DUF4340 domain-containing protein [Gammaproteobacteria bacterium]NNF60329.1 DUF4340 domain-containing protein [Gammaproteobacteria bacterium]NNM20627.1 DUF4340 domain-containing protein [Gammaproteobacteria bacterium]